MQVRGKAAVPVFPISEECARKICFRAHGRFGTACTRVHGLNPPAFRKDGYFTMYAISLAGEWKLRGEFLDVTADRFTEVLPQTGRRPGGADAARLFDARGSARGRRRRSSRRARAARSRCKRPRAERVPVESGWIPDAGAGRRRDEAFPHRGRRHRRGAVPQDEHEKEPVDPRPRGGLVKDFEVSEAVSRGGHRPPEYRDARFQRRYPFERHARRAPRTRSARFPRTSSAFCRPAKTGLSSRLTSGMELHYPKTASPTTARATTTLCDQRVYTASRSSPTAGTGASPCLPAASAAASALRRSAAQKSRRRASIR